MSENKYICDNCKTEYEKEYSICPNCKAEDEMIILEDYNLYCELPIR
jgi:RNA polymerase subunit RPABC4/transcription elongation factor Spt4